MKKLIVSALCAVMVLSTAANASSAFAMEDSKHQAIGEETSGIMVISSMDSNDEAGIVIGAPNPFAECSSLEDAEIKTGFKLTLPEKMPEGYSKRIIETLEKEMIQVFYESGEKEILIRKAKGNNDISGDYNEYSETKTVTVGSLQISTRGTNGKVSVATWVDGEYTYSVSVGFDEAGLDTTVISDLVSSIR